MPTLNQYGSRVANILGKQHDHSIVERAKDAFKACFATRIRQSISKTGIDDHLVIQCKVPLEEETVVVFKNFKSYRTVGKVPIPVRFQNDSPFTYVAIPEEYIPLSFRTNVEILLSKGNQLGGFNKYYTWDNNVIRLYVKISSGLYINDEEPVKELLISSIFENPEEVIAYYSNEDSNDVELPFPNDMLESILLEVLKTEFGYNTPEVEVKS